ncbi:putative transporter [Lyophyllum shimeji]|uniref:Transporter n=1 Tax=Lyophyllum shimeji TaxID=47721 RepID=A0A9P3PR07_LYOSH|nr:putative transporter [Lyophyllum shimeji]
MSPSISLVSDKNGEQDIDTMPEVHLRPARSPVKSFILVLTCTFAMIVNSANNTAVAISLSTIGRSLHIQEVQLQWLISAYPLSSGCLLLVFGRLADLHGRKRTFMVGSSCLAAFTLGCGFANDVVALDILRGFQGIGAAATIPASLGILAHAFPPSRARSVAFASFAAGAPLGAAFGMAVGGALTQTTAQTWRSSFYLEAGLTVLCLVGGIISFDPDCPSTEPDRRVDWLGALLVTAGLVLIVFVLGQGEIAPDGWKTPYIIGSLITGILLLVLFVLWQSRLEKIHDQEQDQSLLRQEHKCDSKDDVQTPTVAGTPAPASRSWLSPPPLMKVSLWRRAKGRFAVMMCIAFLTWCSFLSWCFWAQLYYQSYIGLSPLRTFVRLMPMFVSGIVCNMLVAAFVGYISVLYLIAFGTFGTSLACLLFALIDPRAPYWAFGFPSAIVAVIGADFVFAAGTLFIAKIAEPHEQSLAGALFQTMTQLGTSLGVTVTTVIFNRVTSPDANAERPPPQPKIESYQAAQWGSFAFGVLAMLLAIVFFRGVGVVGHGKSALQREDTEQDQERTAVSSRSQEKECDGISSS